MKQETNREMELLLRRLARRDNTGAPDNNVVSERHMDADEMSAFAEHALPPAARARYTEHLAECGRCREIVVGISASLGHPVAEEVKTSAPAERSSVKSLLASFFSPVFIRYAVPALALVGIIGLGLIVFRQSETEQRTARDQVAQSTGPNAGAAPTQGFRSNSSNEAAKVAPTPAQANATPLSEAPARGVVQSEVPAGVAAPKEAPESAPPAPVASEPKPAKLAAADEEAARREAEADQKKPVTVRREQQADDSVGRARDKADSSKAEASKEESKKEVRSYDGVADTASSRPAKTPAKRGDSKNEVAQNAPSAAGGAGASVGSVKRKDAAEVRSVAGHRFHREGNTWIDTAYEPGRNTMNVSRGSEQYRALIADEPEIRTIAESLSGEVIVVWKGRAYKLR